MYSNLLSIYSNAYEGINRKNGARLQFETRYFLRYCLGLTDCDIVLFNTAFPN